MPVDKKYLEAEAKKLADEAATLEENFKAIAQQRLVLQGARNAIAVMLKKIEDEEKPKDA